MTSIYRVELNSSDSTTIFELLNTEQDVAKQIKIGDMGILIEILQNHPESVEITQIISKLNYSSKTTIYKRIDKMVNLNLVENVDDATLFLDNRTRSVRLTPQGLQLLGILYNSLNLSSK